MTQTSTPDPFNPAPLLEPVDPTVRPAARWPRRILRGICVFVIAAGVFIGTYRLYTQNIDFPIAFHPDEARKVAQILSGGEFRNFNHPLLLLESTEWAMWLFDLPHDEAGALDAGRRVSAAGGALAATAAALIGLAVAGLGGMIVVGVAVALCPHLLVYAHYLKEDAGLAMGLVLVACASCWFCRARGVSTRLVMAVLLGLAAAIAASSKYVGAMAAPVALLVSFIPPARPAPGTGRRWWMIPITVALFTAATAGGVRVINHRGFAQLDTFTFKVQSEYQHGIEEHGGVTMPRPNTYFVRTVGREVAKHVFVLAAIYLLTLVFVRREGWDLALLMLAGGYLAVISWSVIPFHRYALPTVTLLYLIAGVAAAQLVEVLTRKLSTRVPRLRYVFASLLPLIAAGGIAAAQFQRSLHFSNQFKDDSRLLVREWINANLKPPAVLFADSYCMLHYGSDPRMARVPFTARTAGFFLPDATGTPQMLARAGVRYAVVCEMNYARFTDPETAGTPGGGEALFDRRRKWYLDLFANYPIVWKSDDSEPTESYTNPTIRVYDLRPQTSSGKPQK